MSSMRAGLHLLALVAVACSCVCVRAAAGELRGEAWNEPPAPLFSDAVYATQCVAGPCVACNQSSPLSASALQSFPRYTATGQRVSPNLGEYAWLGCHEGRCHWHTAPDFDGPYHTPNSRSPAAYAEGVIMYALLGVLSGTLMFLFAVCLCVGRSPLCWWCGDGRGCCGGSHPTRAGGCCGCMGYRIVTDNGPLHEAKYTTGQRWLVRLGVAAFVAAFLASAIAGETLGNRRVGGSLQAVADVANSPVALASDMVPLVGDFVAGVANQGVLVSLVGLNRTVAQAVDPAALARHTQCVASALLNLPRPTSLLSLVAELNMSIIELGRTSVRLGWERGGGGGGPLWAPPPPPPYRI